MVDRRSLFGGEDRFRYPHQEETSSTQTAILIVIFAGSRLRIETELEVTEVSRVVLTAWSLVAGIFQFHSLLVR